MPHRIPAPWDKTQLPVSSTTVGLRRAYHRYDNISSCLGCVTDWQQETRSLFVWSRVVGDTTSGLSALAGIERPKLKALPASAPERLVLGDRQMSAFATHISLVRNGCHRRKLVARDAVRAPNCGHGHRHSQQEPLSRVKVPPAMNSTC
jgi:hypothetical protein